MTGISNYRFSEITIMGIHMFGDSEKCTVYKRRIVENIPLTKLTNCQTLMFRDTRNSYIDKRRKAKYLIKVDIAMWKVLTMRRIEEFTKWFK